MLLVKLFLLSLLLHIIDDFVLQPICLSKLKQQSFWKEHKDYKEKYRHDYQMALFIHSLSWTIMISLPLFIFSDNTFWIMLIMLPFNIVTHYNTDDAKANKFQLNLIQDQLIHFGQIVLLYVIVWLCQ